VAELQPGAVVRLRGRNNLFNPAPLINVAWMEGRMTQSEWTSTIEQVNACAMRRAEQLAMTHLANPADLRALVAEMSAWWVAKSRREDHVPNFSPSPRGSGNIQRAGH